MRTLCLTLCSALPCLISWSSQQSQVGALGPCSAKEEADLGYLMHGHRAESQISSGHGSLRPNCYTVSVEIICSMNQSEEVDRIYWRSEN